MKEEWLMSGAVVPVDVETTAALVAEIHRLIGVVGNMALAQASQEPVGRFAKFTDGVWRPVTDYSAGVPLYTHPPQRTEPVCPECKSIVLYECVACSSNNYPPKQTEQEPVGKLQEPTVERAWFTIAELNPWANKKILENPQWVMPKNEPERDETLARPERSMKVEGPLHVICQCDKCKPQIAFNAEVVGYVAPQRTWVGLTDEEVTDLWHKTEPYYHEDDFARAIEAKLKEKNT